MITDTLLQKGLGILEEAKTNSEDFRSAYESNLRATGESAEEYSLYEIELSEDYYLVIDFVNFSVEDFSFVNRGHEAHISYNVGEEFES